MGIEYRVDCERGVVFETWTGDVTIADLEGYWTRLLSDTEAVTYHRSVADLTAANVCFNGAELAAAVKKVVLPRIGSLKWQAAYVVSKAVQLGTVRQYGVLGESYLRDAVFEDADEALRWVLRQ